MLTLGLGIWRENAMLADVRGWRGESQRAVQVVCRLCSGYRPNGTITTNIYKCSRVDRGVLGSGVCRCWSDDKSCYPGQDMSVQKKGRQYLPRADRGLRVSRLILSPHCENRS